MASVCQRSGSLARDVIELDVNGSAKHVLVVAQERTNGQLVRTTQQLQKNRLLQDQPRLRILPQFNVI